MRRARTFGEEGPCAVLRDQTGIAIPVVMVVIVVGFALASVASLAALGSIRNTGRDVSDKSAFGVAEAGVQAALYRQNKILTTPVTGTSACLVLSASNTEIGGPPLTDGWCPPRTGTVNGGTYTYRVKPAVDLAAGQRVIEIVSQGTLNGQTRRIKETAVAATGEPAFGDGQVVGLNAFYVEGNAKVNGSMKTNADLRLQGSASVCGPIQVGVGKQIIKDNPSYICPGYPTNQGTTTLGPVDRGDVATNNSNPRLAIGGGDTRQGNSNQIQWDPNTRRLKLEANAILTLGGSNYDLCKLTLTGGSQLIIAQGAKVRLYFDTPESCGLPSNEKQVETQGNTRIHVTSGDPNDLAFLLSGSPTRNTYVWLQGNSKILNHITIYAPQSMVRVEGNADYRGAIAGKEIYIQGSGVITGTSSSLQFTADVETAYKRTQFLECSGAMPAVGAPNVGC